MKIGVISDTHLKGYDPALEKIGGTYFSDVDLILHAGDLVEKEVLGVFSGKTVIAVAGNMDSRAVHEACPRKRVVSVGRFRIGMIHGWGRPEGIEARILEEFRFESIDCLVYGHTHRAVNHLEEGILFFNPGSPTDRFFSSRRSIGILHAGHEIEGSIIELKDGIS